MALKSLCIVTLTCVPLWGCNGSARPAGTPEEEPEALSVTRWSDKTELFAEYPPLVAGATSRFAIHLTRLDTFRPITEGQVEVHLLGGSSQPELFRADAPSRPGIFGVDVTPGRAGRRELLIILRATGVRDEHRIGVVEVHADAAAVRAADRNPGEDGAGITFLKEQQWSLDFATAIVSERPVRESIRVPARVEARPGGAADVAAPIDGRLTRVVELPLGSSVKRGQELARLLPSPPVPGDLPALQRARADANAALVLATRDRERAERLTRAGAAPERRLDEARSAEEQARVRLAAAEASLAQYNTARTGVTSDGDGHFVVRAPLSGVLVRREAAAGANVASGTILFQVVDAAHVHVVGQIPEAHAVRARAASGAELEVPGRHERMPVGRLQSLGKVLEPQSRTIPVTFSLDNRPLGLPVGQSVFLHLLMDATAPRPVVPVEAIVDDGGRLVVFVQRAGETFERRPVTPGPRSGDLVQILDGVQPGDRVVTRGAGLVRLASLSSSVPAHGHVH